MSPPTFDATPARLKVTVPQHALLAPDTIEWIGSLGHRDLSDNQHLALAMMRTTGRATSPMLQAWGVAPTDAGQALRDLVGRGIAVRVGGRRYASYQLAATVPALFDIPAESIHRTSRPGDGVGAQRDAIVQAIQAGRTTIRELSAALGINHRTVTRRVAELIEQRRIEATRPPRSSKQSYRLVEPQGEQ